MHLYILEIVSNDQHLFMVVVQQFWLYLVPAVHIPRSKGRPVRWNLFSIYSIMFFSLIPGKKIHISEATHLALEKLEGGYVTEYRGEMPIKVILVAMINSASSSL